jgi:hypothetical protein
MQKTHLRFLFVKLSDSPNYPLPQNTTIQKEKRIQKVKIRYHSNLLQKADNATLEELAKPIEKFFTSSNNPSITYLQFIYIYIYIYIYILDNFTNKSLNIHSLTEEVNIGLSLLMDIIDQIRPLVNDRSLKIRLTKLSNLLFKALPVPSS